MASELLGRAPCPECGFAHAHIKIKTDKEKANPYRHCPECGAQYFPRNQTQADNLRKQIKAAKIATPEPISKVEKKQPEPISTVEKKEPESGNFKIVFGVRVPA
jgi:predicted RNA-binding Zn-ribbon protein involved in translation (DUF1610 family)